MKQTVKKFLNVANKFVEKKDKIMGGQSEVSIEKIFGFTLLAYEVD